MSDPTVTQLGAGCKLMHGTFGADGGRCFSSYYGYSLTKSILVLTVELVGKLAVSQHVNRHHVFGLMMSTSVVSKTS